MLNVVMFKKRDIFIIVIVAFLLGMAFLTEGPEEKDADKRPQAEQAQ